MNLYRSRFKPTNGIIYSEIIGLMKENTGIRMNIVIKPNKLILGMGIFFSIVMLIIVGVMLALHEVAVALVCAFGLIGAFMLIGIYQLSYITLNDTSLKIKVPFKHETTLLFKDIKDIIILTVNGMKSFVIINKNKVDYYTIDSIFSNFNIYESLFLDKGIRFIDVNELMDKNQSISKYYAYMNKAKQSYYQSIISSRKESKRFPIAKYQPLLKLINKTLIVSAIIGFIFSGKFALILNACIILVTYGIYVWFYPNAYIELKEKQKGLELPWIAASLALLNILFATNHFTEYHSSYFTYTVIFTLLLYLPFLIISLVRKCNDTLVRKLLVLIACFTMGFVLVFPVNILLTFTPSSHKNATVVDKHISSGKTRDYVVEVFDGNSNTEFNVSSQLYQVLNVNETVQVCIKTSIFNFSYASIHQ